MQSFDNIIVTWRKGTLEDPYVDITDTIHVINGRAVLNEIPDKFSHVNIDGYAEVVGIPNELEFQVNYATGTLIFNTAAEGNTLTVSYKGRGIIQIPADRVVSHNKQTNTFDSIQAMVDKGQAGIDALEQLEEATVNALSYKWRGVWSNTATYAVNEMVNYQNTSYICKQANTSQTPTLTGSVYWDVLAEKGSSVNPVVDDSLTVRNSADSTKNIKIQYGVSGGIEFVVS